MGAAGPRLGLLAVLALLAGGLARAGTAATTAAGTLDTFTARVSAAQSRPGTAKAPARLGFGLVLDAAPAHGATYSAPVTDISITLTGVRAHPARFPVCSTATIAALQTDSICPAGALVARGELTAQLWNPAVSTAPARTCTPLIDVWNAGAGHLAYFLRFPVGHVCAGLVDGALPPWTGTLRRSGTALVDDIPLPPAVSTDTGGTGLFAGLVSLRLRFAARTVAGPRGAVAFFGSVSCEGGRRPDSVTVRAADGTRSQVTRLRGFSRC